MSDPVKETLMARVYDVAKESPLERANKLSSRHKTNVYLKREDLQPVHSFKLRGAYNKMASLTTNEREKGVIAASAGNHAQGVALSGKKLGIKTVIVMPKTTPSIKVEAVRNHGSEVILYGDNYSEAQAHCDELAKKSGMVFVHPFDDELVIAGQGTVGREIIEQLPDVTHILVPVGGGGLIAGIAQFVKSINPDVQIIGVEPEDSNAMTLSLESQKRVELSHVGIFADGVAVKQVGQRTFSICQRYVDEMINVNNDEICAAVKSVFEDTRSIVEPAGALSVAGIIKLRESYFSPNDNVVAICSGANMTFERLQYIAERTLLGSGKEALFAIKMPEKSGALQAFCKQVINGHSITEFNYRLQDPNAAHVLMAVSIESIEDKQRIMNKMTTHGYSFDDLTNDDIAKQHVRHMIGGKYRGKNKEVIYEILFPEKPGALLSFLEFVSNKWNISLFNYRGQGADTGKVLIGFESDNSEELEKTLLRHNYTFELANSRSLDVFLK